MKKSNWWNVALVSLVALESIVFVWFVTQPSQNDGFLPTPQYVVTAPTADKATVEVEVVELLWVATSTDKFAYYALVQELYTPQKVGYVRLTSEQYVELKAIRTQGVAIKWLVRAK